MIDRIEQIQLVSIAEPGVLELPALPESRPADRNPALVYLAGLSAGSRRVQRIALTQMADILIPGVDWSENRFFAFPWHELRYQHTAAIRAKLADSHKPSTGNRYLTALRCVLKECRRLKLMSGDDYQDAVDLRPIPGTLAPQAEVGRHIQPGELRALLSTCYDRRPASARDAAIIAIAYTCGLRRAELSALNLADYDTDNATLFVRHGKGNKERVLPVCQGALDALADWLHVRGLEPGALFLTIKKGGRIQPGGLNPQTISDVMEMRAKEAGVKKFSPHDFRRTFAGDLLDAGADIVTVQKLMGHANVTTTAGYDRRDAKAKRAAVNRLHLPFTRQWED